MRRENSRLGCVGLDGWTDGRIGIGGDDGNDGGGLKTGGRRKQVGNLQLCSGRSRAGAAAGAGAGAGGAIISSQELGSSILIMELQSSPGRVTNLDGSKLDGTAGSSPELAGLRLGLLQGMAVRTVQPALRRPTSFFNL